MRSVVLLALFAIASSAVAQDDQEWTWEEIPGLTSAELAATGWQLVGSAAFSAGTAVGVATHWTGERDGKQVTLACFEIGASDIYTCLQPVGPDQ